MKRDPKPERTLEERFPLGAPVNRPPANPLRRVHGRPGWWVDIKGVERYIEPPRPPSSACDKESPR